MLRLVHLTGSHAGRIRVIDASDQELILGRDASVSQVVFGPEDRVVGRRHAAVQERDGVLVLRDLDSSTGTFVDGARVAQVELRPGDVFELGRGGPRLRVEAEEAGHTRIVRRDSEVATPPGSRLRLTVTSGRRRGESFEPGGSVVRIGRAPASTLAFPDERIVSAQHAKIARLEEGFVLIDLESTNGTFLNGLPIERARLRSGDVLRLGPNGPTVEVEVLAPRAAEPDTVVIPNFAELKDRRAHAVLLQEIEIPSSGLVVGRGAAADVALDSPIVSRRHARLFRDGPQLIIEDLDSANGTYVDGARTPRAALSPDSRIIVGPFRLELANERLRVFDTRRRTEIVAARLSVTSEGRGILNDVSVTFPPGSFTAIVGPSGSGKSTLLRALNGAQPADRGHVRVNGVDLYTSGRTLEGAIGSVPQDDIVHLELTPAECLHYAAGLRLPAQLPAAERKRRIADVLATLELTERQDVPVQNLSGGQRKRVSIAVELLTDPDVLFLDEPASGLDPGLEEALMLLLRELSYKGKTVVIVTHTLDHIHLCDGLVLLAAGQLAFAGTVEEARRRFDISHLPQLYSRLRERAGTAWDRTPSEHLSPPDPVTPAAEPPPRAPTSAFRQLRVSCSRYLRTLARDRRNVLLLLGQAPLVATLIGLSLLYGASEVAYTKPKNTILLLLAMSAVWFGCSNAVRELVKERPIFVREQMVGLRGLPYVLSKLLVLSGLALVQCLAFLLILDRWFGIPGNRAALLAAMMLAAVLGLALGLAISAASRTADRAMTLLPIVLIPQVLFTFPAVQLDMKGPAGIVARGMPTWWAFDLLRRIALHPDDSLPDEALDAKLAAGGPVLMTRGRFESMLRQGFPMWSYRSAAEITWIASGPERWSAVLPARLRPDGPAIIDVSVMAAMGTLMLTFAVRRQRRQV